MLLRNPIAIGKSGPHDTRAAHAKADTVPRLRSNRASPSGFARCACGGLCPRCVQGMDQPSPKGFGAAGEQVARSRRTTGPVAPTRQNESGIQIHPSAPEVTAPRRARAATIGNDIYFHPGQYRPGTPGGDALIAHELAHTQQTARAGTADESRNSEPALEQNANALARGETSHVLAAPPGAVLCSPFDNETTEDHARRQTLLESIRNAIARIIELRRSRSLLEGTEVEVERGGVSGIVYGAGNVDTPNEDFFSYEARDASLQRIVRTLQAMAHRYQTAALEADFTAPTHAPSEEGGGFKTKVLGIPGTNVASTDIGGGSAAWVDLQAAYLRFRQAEVGQAALEQQLYDWHYLDPGATVAHGRARGAPRVRRSGLALGIYLVVPDPGNDPLRYWHLSGFDRIPRGAAIVEAWSDDFGYYYNHNSGRIDIPSPWGR